MRDVCGVKQRALTFILSFCAKEIECG